ncbi:MAG: HEAT repeat domain-containing protein [Coriobacteriales bacterium]
MPAENIELLIEFTHDDDPRARAMAVAGLAKIADARGFAPVLVCLFDPVDEVRAAAATALGIFGDDRAYEALVECLNDPNERVGVNCAWSLGQIPTTRCLDKLCELVADDEVAPSLRVAAATAIGERSERAGFDITTSDALIERARVVLLNVLESDEDELRAAGIWTLGHFPADKQTTEACIEALDDEYAWVVRYAIEALAHFRDLAALEPLLDMAESDDDEIRDLACQAVDLLRNDA